MDAQDIYEGVDFGPDVDLDELVMEQFEEGLYHAKEDSAPSDFFIRAWEHLSLDAKGRLAETIYRLLDHHSSTVKKEAQRLEEALHEDLQKFV